MMPIEVPIHRKVGAPEHGGWGWLMKGGYILLKFWVFKLVEAHRKCERLRPRRYA
jgi:hypothetical protein